MSTAYDKYMPAIRDLESRLSAEDAEWAGWRDRKSAYDIELAEATRELKAKYGFDEIVSAMDSKRRAIACLEAELLRARCRLVVTTADLLFRADPGVRDRTEAWLAGDAYGLEFSWGMDGPSPDAYHAHAAAITDDAWWDGERPAMQENGMIWLHAAGVGTGIGRGLLYDRLGAFLSEADRMLEWLGRQWAESWLAGAALDREKRRALYEAMKKEFGGT